MPAFFERLKSGLDKTRRSLVDSVVHAVTGKARLDRALVEELENMLLAADLGVSMTTAFLERLRERIGVGQAASREAVLACLQEFLIERLERGANSQSNFLSTFYAPGVRPYVLMMVGVNGVGKTTTIAKLAHHFRQHGRSVLVAAADTFRAAAADQLEIWAQRARVEIIKTRPGADPAAVAFDALNAAQARQIEVVIVDTAGRLHTKSNLMEELQKMIRVMKRVIPAAPHDVFLVLDANTGQNGLRQAQTFFDTAGVTGLVVTKLDGTAKGGIIFAIEEQLKLPVRFIGVGEGIDDLQPFEPKAFIAALFS
ncbi:MAG: signal recognition particle-docking protein FtsY [candidate division KSB1 bacterium]|nr:signal recognition particle-docking protein FtsY [candidate division KSB1 bacterium]MDZ7276026.1 signal recognition particle-docking protein FtsY [candidate division KSB1 bacterium]MDZ7285692.1 signal recognition particle-docking protein FtsY [candidate division KSB1 bacterium]MDZ7298724.1 signal recognition particle-docking protein FtsY [candidate division KSB1 bacterium]MDZ7309545.1 signal recognition particle-docking protein FtsY [candidate division KSB1 bacterium]